MSNDTQKVTNMNHLRLDALEEFFRKQIVLITDMGKLNELLSEDMDEFVEVLNELKDHAKGKDLIAMENEFNYRFELFMKPIDITQNVMIDDIFYDFDEVGLTVSQALMEDELFAAGRLLLPNDPEGESEDELYNCINHCEGSSYGQIWPPKDIPPLIEHISNPKVLKHAEFLGIVSELKDLIEINRLIVEYSKENGLDKTLFTLRTKRARIALGYPLIISNLYPDLSHTDSYRDIDPRDIIHPILETRSEQNTMLEFSFNDLSHDSFYQIAKPVVDEDHSDFKGTMYRDLKSDYEEYDSLYSTLKQSPLWSEYMESESIWYRETERLLLAMKFSFESFDAEYPDRWKIHTEGVRYKSAMELWEMLPHNVFDSYIFISRGDAVSVGSWAVMKTDYTEVTAKSLLKDIYADKIFEDCLEADRVSEKIARKMVDDGLSIHRKFRKCRHHLTLILKFINRN